MASMSFDDVLLVPQYSDIESRKVLTTAYLGDIDLYLPIISSPMDTVTEAMAAMIDAHGVRLSTDTIAQQTKPIW